MSTAEMPTFGGSKTLHGSNSGFTKHQYLGERPCDPCYQAKAKYDARRKSATEQVRRSRDSSLAQRKAYSRLAHMYPTLYSEFYAEEKARIVEEREVSGS